MGRASASSANVAASPFAMWRAGTPRPADRLRDRTRGLALEIGFLGIG
jgi:hypothetical protein